VSAVTSEALLWKKTPPSGVTCLEVASEYSWASSGPVEARLVVVPERS